MIQGIFPGVTTQEIDQLTAETCKFFFASLSFHFLRRIYFSLYLFRFCSITGAYSATYHHDWSILASRIAVSDLHKKTVQKFSDCVVALYEYRHPKTNAPAPLISDEIYQIVMDNKDRLDAAIVHSRDFEYVFVVRELLFLFFNSCPPFPALTILVSKLWNDHTC